MFVQLTGNSSHTTVCSTNFIIFTPNFPSLKLNHIDCMFFTALIQLVNLAKVKQTLVTFVQKRTYFLRANLLKVNMSITETETFSQKCAVAKRVHQLFDVGFALC